MYTVAFVIEHARQSINTQRESIYPIPAMKPNQFRRDGTHYFYMRQQTSRRPRTSIPKGTGWLAGWLAGLVGKERTSNMRRVKRVDVSSVRGLRRKRIEFPWAANQPGRVWARNAASRGSGNRYFPPRRHRPTGDCSDRPRRGPAATGPWDDSASYWPGIVTDLVGGRMWANGGAVGGDDRSGPGDGFFHLICPGQA